MTSTLQTRFIAVLSAAVLLSMAAAAGCAATNETEFSNGGENLGGAGGVGGAGGSGGINTSLCDIDCSTIETPQCFVSVCNEGMHPGPVGSCVVAPSEDGEPCNDALFCTVEDSCQAGQCVGGSQNDCGITAPQCEEVTCNETTSSCTTAPAPDGAECDPGDLCTVGSSCTNGLCTGGVTNDCFFAPVPNECYVAVCEPTTGDCNAEIGNEGLGCTDLSDLCSVDNTCSSGVCSGGTPKDCSALDIGCFNGICDPTTGQCVPDPVPAGGSCAAAADDCNEGICDSMGNCDPSPINENGSCNTDDCYPGQTCVNGNCQGGTQITMCGLADSCCPAGCTIATDNDCLTEITLATLNNGHNGNLGGIANADAMCDAQAATNGIGGTWKAVLSSSSQDVIDIVPSFLQTMPVKNLNGVTLWNTWAEVFTASTWIGAGAKLYSFDGKLVEESQGANPEWTDADGWHGSTAAGLVDANFTCSDWTATSGNGRGGEWDFGNFITGTLGQEQHVCTYTAAVACVRIGP